ncbi:uncharacterized protein LOC135834762 [Planococcus citri]|uniref:uncharacterized protein LOC135834762 n=1 Tax=Planococcus citri TaxID=170843 RepID=UPI0031F9EFC2
MNLKRAMNNNVKEYADANNKMKKTNETLENGQECMKNLEEKLLESFYQHLNNCNERNDGSCNSNAESNITPVNNLNRNSESTNGKPQNGDLNRMYNRNSSYRNIYVSSSSEDDDEHCVYTYKGAEIPNVADSAFNVVEVLNGRSSPDMDYLEMDFDPGPSNGQDSDSDNASNDVPNTEESDRFSERKPSDRFKQQETHCDENANCYVDQVPVENVNESPSEAVFCSPVSKQPSTDDEQPCCSKSLHSYRSNEIFEPKQYFCTGDSSDEEVPNSDYDDVTFIVDGYHEAKRLESESAQGIPSVSVSDADHVEENFCCFDNLLRTDPTYCISAIINLLTALHIPHDSHYARCMLSKLLQRREVHPGLPIVDYLILRAVEDVNETELVGLLAELSDHKFHSRFFTTYPKRNIDYLEWLSEWISKGALPVVTRNVLERGSLPVKNIIYNQWRHNVVYKTDSAHVSLTNPLERIEKSVLSRQLCQPSLIYIKRSTMMKKWHPHVDLRPLLKPENQQWFNENVLGQLASMIREHNNGAKTKHYIRIPSNCQCGITLFASSDNSKLCKEIDEASELPLA